VSLGRGPAVVICDAATVDGDVERRGPHPVAAEGDVAAGR